MKKKLLVFVGFLMLTQIGFSGGLVHNTNQSTAWTRMMMRNASTDLDAVFYNPAGLMKIGDGFHFSINNQSIWQNQTIESSFTHLNNSSYEGTISAPVFPGVYAAWKKGKVAVSVGFNPVGGGGGATFDKGVPLMEVPFSGLVPALSPLGVTGYNMNMSFEGSSIYWGIQAGVSYEINENISVFAGARYIIAKNTYQGYIKDVTVATPSGDAAPAAYVQGVSDQAAGGAVMATGAADGMQPIIDGGGSSFTLAQLEGAGMITAEQRIQLEGGLLQAGIPQEDINEMNAGEVQGTYYAAGTELSATSQYLAGQAAYLGVITADQDADVVQKGSGITPILGANISLMEDKLNFGIKYEFQTNMDLTNEVNDNKGFIMGMDPTTGNKEYMFVDGDKVNADIPAMLSVGGQYEIIAPLRVQLGFIYYFDKNAGWAKETETVTNPEGISSEITIDLIDKNFVEYGFGVEYDITEKFIASVGVLLARTGVNEKYQSNLNFSLSTNTIGGGFAYKINERFTAQLGGYYVTYLDQTYDKSYEGTNYTETYDKETFAVSIGIDISL